MAKTVSAENWVVSGVGKLDKSSKQYQCPIIHKDETTDDTVQYIDSGWLPAWTLLMQQGQGQQPQTKILISDSDALARRFFDKVEEAEGRIVEGMQKIVSALSETHEDIPTVELSPEEHNNSNVVHGEEERSMFLPLKKNVLVFRMNTVDDSPQETAQPVNQIHKIAQEETSTTNNNRIQRQPENTYIRLVVSMPRAKFNPSQKYKRYVNSAMTVDQVFVAEATEDHQYKAAHAEEPAAKRIKLAE
jgi:hypothetical protein